MESFCSSSCKSTTLRHSALNQEKGPRESPQLWYSSCPHLGDGSYISLSSWAFCTGWISICVWEQSPNFLLWNEISNIWYKTKLLIALSPPDLPNLVFLPANSTRKIREVLPLFPLSSTSLRGKHSLKRWMLCPWAETRLGRDLFLGEPLEWYLSGNWKTKKNQKARQEVPLWWWLWSHCSLLGTY